MKIEGPSKSQKASSTSKTSKTGKTNSSFGDMVTGAAKETSGVAATQSIAKVDALLAVQGAESAMERKARRKMVERGDKVIRQLDHLRLGLLTGKLTIGQVIDLADVIASHREKVNDPEMTAVLDEIDMRAQIEIAKMRKAMEAAI